ncbi:hypothetical protein EV421DRAFT_864018 [Armillaria borealis]|uniref:MFS general substrate transporter n=1 Tax=Armillaria borealis TaxID=47425 RepID=A0AA39JDQ3_9AGAR|nr:hypothetical protein EV421DRAFT_864018 [Armillaria borealis]
MVLAFGYQVHCFKSLPTLQAPALPFPVFVIAYMINGVGLASKMHRRTVMSHVISIILRARWAFSTLYMVLVPYVRLLLPLSSRTYPTGPSTIGIAWTRGAEYYLPLGRVQVEDSDECLAEIGESSRERGASQHSPLRQILSLKNVHLLASFILVYVGVEFTLGGWIVTYVIQLRGGGENAGYISSGFFAGLTVGRLALLWVNKLVGERRVLFLYALFAIGLEVVVWRVPSLIGGGVAVSLVGVLLGPMYPIVMNHSSRILPPWLLSGCIGWIAGLDKPGPLFPIHHWRDGQFGGDLESAANACRDDGANDGIMGDRTERKT